MKGCDPFVAFYDAYFLYTANTLPKILAKDSDELDSDELVQKGALNVRMKLHQFKVSYPSAGKLPFKTADVALALHYLYNSNKVEPDNDKGIPS